MPQAKLVLVPDSGHTPHLERPNVFAAVLNQFIHQNTSASEITFKEIQPKSLLQKVK